MSEEKQKVVNTTDEIQEVIELFYEQNDKEAFEKFNFAIGNIMSMVDVLHNYKSINTDFEFDEIKVCNILKEAMDALQSDDKVLLADILQYDFVEYMNDLAEQMD